MIASVVTRSSIALLLFAGGAIACSVGKFGSDPSDFVGYVMDAIHKTPARIDVLEMTTKTAGFQMGTGWNIASAGYVSCPVNFLGTESYDFIVTASGFPSSGEWPNMQIRIDGRVIANITVDSDAIGQYQVTANVTAGVHQIAIAFTNDALGTDGADRGLYVETLWVGTTGSYTEPSPPPPPVEDASFADVFAD